MSNGHSDQPRMTPRRMIYAALGILCVILAFIGIVLPGLPTTGFVLLASYFFCRSIPAFDRRLRSNKWLGPPLKRFEETRALTARAKAASMVSMWIGIGIAIAVTADGWRFFPALLIVLGLIGSGVILFWIRTDPSG